LKFISILTLSPFDINGKGINMSRKNDISSSLCNGLHKKNRNSTQEPYAGDKQWDIVLKDENNNNTPPHNRKRCSIKSPWTQAIPNQQHTRVVVYISYQ